MLKKSSLERQNKQMQKDKKREIEKHEGEHVDHADLTERRKGCMRKGKETFDAMAV